MQYDLERFLNVRSASHASFSPDGRRVAFLTEITGVPQVWSVSVEGGWPQQLTYYPERVQTVEYCPATQWLLFGMDTGGDERRQLYLLSDEGDTVTPLTASPETIHTFGAWSPDGNSIAFVSNERHPAYFDVYLRELAASESRLVYQQDSNIPVLLFVHGGPESQSRPSFNPVVQYFAYPGYGVLVPNV
jgi:Tol biopolymer transport system component